MFPLEGCRQDSTQQLRLPHQPKRTPLARRLCRRATGQLTVRTRARVASPPRRDLQGSLLPPAFWGLPLLLFLRELSERARTLKTDDLRTAASPGADSYRGPALMRTEMEAVGAGSAKEASLTPAAVDWLNSVAYDLAREGTRAARAERIIMLIVKKGARRKAAQPTVGRRRSSWGGALPIRQFPLRLAGQ